MQSIVRSGNKWSGESKERLNVEYFGNNEVTLKGCFHQGNPEITRRPAFIGNIINHSAEAKGSQFKEQSAKGVEIEFSN